MTDLYTLERGTAPLVISIPHLGTQIPANLQHLYTEEALKLADTDWHLDRLYAFARALNATLIGAKISRYVIDLNRPPNDESLYPGQTTTGLCPTETFRGQPLYKPACAPNETERAERVAQYWQPYHTALSAELTRLRKRHTNVLLWEAHSIASILPRLFDNKLPDLNLGTQDGRTCAPEVQQAAIAAMSASPYTGIANGRFKGGYITRSFGAPSNGIHAIQLEMCQSTYMNEAAPFDYQSEKAEAIQPTLRSMLSAALEAIEKLAPTLA
ncbi:N-formylglutamate deformylase [Burkholderia sp. Ax-1719]|uniref:N-formylglutamate deformylase n=1 Tax=Burkholderia sp. Ax-1719 TaxID=2608334 RepID=UPI00141E1EF3|nr:N-formylglutamate deformylase [Burkholderia sp. Ax-1719]NIE62490.1 N-formylglutamate deformylase [Burkholderia sp. Ax-1719]